MKGKLVLINWMMSFMGLSIDLDRSPMWAVWFVVGWFGGATLLLKRAERKGWMKQFEKPVKAD